MSGQASALVTADADDVCAVVCCLPGTLGTPIRLRPTDGPAPLVDSDRIAGYTGTAFRSITLGGAVHAGAIAQPRRGAPCPRRAGSPASIAA